MMLQLESRDIEVVFIDVEKIVKIEGSRIYLDGARVTVKEALILKLKEIVIGP